MKSKIVFTMVLFSLLLNIFHDFFINNQIQTDVSKSIIVKKSTVTKHQYTLCDLHEVFHFSAILSVFPSIEPSFIVSTQLSFIEKIPPHQILESSFKPPRT
jgi:hypothetical protein